MAGPKVNESFEQYKQRVIDPISDSYCAAKWLNATIWLNNGQTTSCHHPLGHPINPAELEKNPSAIHNTKHKKAMRKMMLKGQRPQECEYCWKIEDIGRNDISDRVYKTAVFDEEDIAKTVATPWNDNIMLKTLEISFDRGCNFACSYCNPSFSSAWVKDIHKYGPYHNIDGDARSHYINAADHAIAIPEAENPYVQAFWRWWDEGLSDSLDEIRITGGEPLLAEGTWKLFDWFKNNQEKVNARKKPLRFAVNSNLVPDDKLMDKLIEASQYVPWFEVYTSCESVGKHAEYIRDGLDWNKLLRNMHRLHTEGNVKRTHMMMTINSLCLASITDFMDEMLKFKIEHNTWSPTMSLNILRFPSFQSCAMLPTEIRQHYSKTIQKWLDDRIAENIRLQSGHKIFTDIEREQTQRLVDYLDVIKTPHKNVKDKSQNVKDFKQFYHQYDVRRGKDFRKTFPQIYIDWLDSIDTVLPTREEIISNNYRKEMSNITRHPTEDPSKDIFINPDINNE